MTIVCYARLSEQFPHLRKLRFLSTILDEAHHLKNEKDLRKPERERILKAIDDGHSMSLHRTEIAFELVRTIKHVYCLTGTPILSRPRELFNLLRLTRHPSDGASKSSAKSSAPANRPLSGGTPTEPPTSSTSPTRCTTICSAG